MRTATLDRVFHALSDPTRRAMLAALASGEQTVGRLAAPHPITLMASSKHVKVLERAGLIRRTVRGRTHVCSLEPAALSTANDWIREFQRFWDRRLDALQHLFKEPRS